MRPTRQSVPRGASGGRDQQVGVLDRALVRAAGISQSPIHVEAGLPFALADRTVRQRGERRDRVEKGPVVTDRVARSTAFSIDRRN
jgi:hypothetical protein